MDEGTISLLLIRSMFLNHAYTRGSHIISIWVLAIFISIKALHKDTPDQYFVIRLVKYFYIYNPLIVM